MQKYTSTQITNRSSHNNPIPLLSRAQCCADFRDMEKRDRDDGSRADSPLTLDDRYVLIDSSDRPFEAVVSEIEGRVREGI